MSQTFVVTQAIQHILPFYHASVISVCYFPKLFIYKCVLYSFPAKENHYFSFNVTIINTSASVESCVGEPMISGNYSLVDNKAFTASSSRDATHLPFYSRWYPGSMGKE